MKSMKQDLQIGDRVLGSSLGASDYFGVVTGLVVNGGGIWFGHVSHSEEVTGGYIHRDDNETNSTSAWYVRRRNDGTWSADSDCNGELRVIPKNKNRYSIPKEDIQKIIEHWRLEAEQLSTQDNLMAAETLRYCAAQLDGI
jgi:hypothetical protein